MSKMWKMSIPSITGYFFKAEISSWSHFGVVGVESARVGSSRVESGRPNIRIQDDPSCLKIFGIDK